MFGTHVGAAAKSVRRALPSLGLGALLSTQALGASVPALAQDDSTTPVPNGIVRDHRGENRTPRSVPRTPDPDAPPPIVHDHRADQMGGEPVARVQVILKSVHIINDRDWGDGDFDFWYTLVCADEVSNTCLGYSEVFLDGYGKKFSAGSGDDYTLNQTLPVDGSASPGYPATAENGYPLYPGRNYRLRF